MNHDHGDAMLTQLRDIIQEDVGRRGLAADPKRNLINACPDDFAAACHSLAGHAAPGLAVVTGFFIPTATPPAGETDGPPGALFLARALVPLGVPVLLITDDFCERALAAGLAECGLRKAVPLVTLPAPAQGEALSDAEYWGYLDERKGIPALTHLLAIERAGPSRADNRCCTARGRDITAAMSPAHKLFSEPERQARNVITIGIGDGGNEIGMGKIPWDVIERNIPNGRQIACKTPADHLIVCGVSNFGAYALAAGVAILRGKRPDPALFDPAREREILAVMVEEGELVDGVLSKPSVSVDGLSWEQYGGLLTRIGQIASR